MGDAVELEDLKEAFALFASDEGVLAASKAGTVLRAVGLMSVGGEAEVAAVAAMDPEGTGSVRFPAFAAVAQELANAGGGDDADAEMAELREAFDCCKDAGTGLVSVAEMQRVMGSLAKRLEGKGGLGDRDGGGGRGGDGKEEEDRHLSWEEFVRFVRG